MGEQSGQPASSLESRTFGSAVTYGSLAEARLASTTALLRGWLWETDAEHRFRYMSDSVALFAGRSPEWHYGKTREEIGDFTFNEPWWEQYREDIAARRPFGPLEFQRLQDGKSFWMRTVGAPHFNSAGDFCGYRGIAFDITNEMAERHARRKAESALSLSRALLTATFHSFPFGISIYDKEWTLKFANTRYYTIMGISSDEFPIGSSAIKIKECLAAKGELDGVNGEELARHLKCLMNGQSHVYERTRPGGSRLEVTGTPLPTGGYVRYYRDVTNIHSSELQLRGQITNLQGKIRALEDVLQISDRDLVGHDDR
jgi:PAS domain-containing protein